MSSVAGEVPAVVSSAEGGNSSTRIRLPEFIPQFDGLRGIAILAVMATHSAGLRALGLGPLVEYGRLGVDLFFVLSGFLITGILLDSADSPHYYRNFYARRALRIWPLYYGFLLFLVVALPFFARIDFANAAVTHPAYLIFYIQNCVPGYVLPLVLSPTWSLAVEEQFYLVWPTVVRLARGAVLPALLCVVAVSSLVTRLFLFKAGLPMDFVHHFTLARLEPIALGSLAAWWLRSPRVTLVGWRTGSMAAIIAGFFGVILTRLFWGHQSTIISYLFFALLFTGVLGVSAIANAGSLLYRLLCMPWLRYIGKISYGLYLIHIPADLAVQLIMRRVAGPGAMSRPILLFLTVAALLLAVGVESVLWRYVEVPLLRLKRHFSAKRPLAELSTACGIAR